MCRCELVEPDCEASAPKRLDAHRLDVQLKETDSQMTWTNEGSGGRDNRPQQRSSGDILGRPMDLEDEQADDGVGDATKQLFEDLERAVFGGDDSHAPAGTGARVPVADAVPASEAAPAVPSTVPSGRAIEEIGKLVSEQVAHAEASDRAAAHRSADTAAASARSDAVAAETPATTAGSSYETGQLVEGVVVETNEHDVIIRMPDGHEGVISRRHLFGEGITSAPEPQIGEWMTAAVLVREDHDGRLVLSRTWALKTAAWEAINASLADDTTLVGRVERAVRGGLSIDIGIRAFMPGNLVDDRRIPDLSVFEGENMEVKVVEADEQAGTVIVSRRAVMRRKRRELGKDLWSEIKVGDIREGVVAWLADFGVFIDLGGVVGLAHISELSWRRVEHPSAFLRPGDEVKVRVINVDEERQRVGLSIRSLTPDPLESIKVGEVLHGVITRLVDFGAFVLVDNLFEGLVHISNLAEQRISVPEEVVSPGQEVQVKVLAIDVERRRMDLSLKDA